MIYGYVRVSTDKQIVDNQQFELTNWAKAKGWTIDGWVEETISGAKDYNKRKLGDLLKKLQRGDVLICAELSRLGRNLLMVMEILNHCLKHGIVIMTSKENYTLGDDINAKVLAFAFGLAAEIERKMISMRTKEALALRKAQGVHLGRPKGRLSDTVKLTGREEEITKYLGAGLPKRKVAEKLGVHRMTLTKYLGMHPEKFKLLPPAPVKLTEEEKRKIRNERNKANAAKRRRQKLKDKEKQIKDLMKQLSEMQNIGLLEKIVNKFNKEKSK